MRYSRYNVVARVGDRVGLFAGISGGFVTLSTDDLAAVDAFVEGTDDGTSVADLLEELVRMGAVANDDHDELAVLRRRYDLARWRSDALGYTIVSSLGCNFACPYCFEDKRPSLLKPAVADALVGVLEDSLPSIARLSVTWMGGEPLLGAEQLFALSKRFVEVCDRHGKEYSASIITNGWHLDGEMAARLKAHHVESAQVTIDGPPDIHDAMRPRVGGGPTFERLIANVVEAAEHLQVNIRVNVDTSNAHRIDELLDRLVEAGLVGKVAVGPGRLTDAVSNEASPLATFTKSCLSTPDFADYELAFHAQAEARGFRYPGPPQPIATPCTAVRSREIVVGSDGEMWKCWDDIGDPARSIGTVFDYRVTNVELERWLRYHPADDPQCSTCIAMPVCMGGCAHHEFNSDDREARCGSFRHNHQQRIEALTVRSLGLNPGPVPPLPRYDVQPARRSPATRVTIGRRPDHGLVHTTSAVEVADLEPVVSSR